MAIPSHLLRQIADDVRSHCASRGYVSGPNWNPMEAQDPVAALAMACLLSGSGQFDDYIAIAPEGHVYGYFFERIGVRVQSLFVDYPPRKVTGADTLSGVTGRRVLLIEDDVVSGVSLQLVVAALWAHQPASVAVYLGRRADSQFPENVPAGVATVYLAESHLVPADRARDEAEFLRIFRGGQSRKR